LDAVRGGGKEKIDFRPLPSFDRIRPDLINGKWAMLAEMARDPELQVRADQVGRAAAHENLALEAGNAERIR
jgi:hypothetical protein